MKGLKALSKVSIVVLLAFSMIKCEKEKQTIYIKGVRCNFTSVFYPNVSCFGKSYNRSFSTINVLAFVKVPLKNFLMEMKLFYKYGTIYREVMHTIRVDWCQLMQEKNPNIMIKQLLNLMEDSVPSILHECPYKELLVKDCNVKTRSLLSLIPAGDYKMIFYIFDAKGDELLVVNVIGAMLSPLKESFG